jgi:hypothetical protein
MEKGIMGYATPQQRITYSWTGMDFGVGADVASSFKGPKGMQGRLKDIVVTATEVFTTGGAVKLGTASDDDAYASFNTLTTAATDTIVATGQTGAIISAGFAADTQIEVVFKAVTAGAGGTGIANVSIVVDWF